MCFWGVLAAVAAATVIVGGEIAGVKVVRAENADCDIVLEKVSTGNCPATVRALAYSISLLPQRNIIPI